jgi:hypothetical protein
VLAQSQQYTANANSAQTSLNTEDDALTQVRTSCRACYSDLALEANSGTQSSQDLSAIAAQAQQIQTACCRSRIRRTATAIHICGYRDANPAVRADRDRRELSGDSGQRQVQIAAGQTIAAGDSGDAVFNKSDRQRHLHGDRERGQHRQRPDRRDHGDERCRLHRRCLYDQFHGAANAYQVDQYGAPDDGNLHTGPGDRVRRAAGQLERPARDRRFLSSGAEHQSEPVHDGAESGHALQAGIPTPRPANPAEQFDGGRHQQHRSGADQILDVQASVGARLNTITTQLSVATSQQTQLQTSISSLQSLDYAIRDHDSGLAEHDS